MNYYTKTSGGNNGFTDIHANGATTKLKFTTLTGSMVRGTRRLSLRGRMALC